MGHGRDAILNIGNMRQPKHVCSAHGHATCGYGYAFESEMRRGYHGLGHGS